MRNNCALNYPQLFLLTLSVVSNLIFFGAELTRGFSDQSFNLLTFSKDIWHSDSQVMLCSRNVTLYYCEFMAEWSQLQLDLFLIFILTYLVICTVCSVCRLAQWSTGSCDDKRMCSILGMNTIVTMVCYCICLSTNFSPWHCFCCLHIVYCSNTLYLV